MEAKKPYFLAFLALFVFLKLESFSIDETIYKKQARQWITSHIYNSEINQLKICKEDLLLIVNLCHLSYLRSLKTLEAQDVALKRMETTWKGWHNIACNRLDPSKEQQYYITDAEKKSDLFWELHDQHKKIGTTYTKAVNNIVHGAALTTINAKNAVDTMRSHARAAIAQELISLQKLLGKLFYESQKKSNRLTEAVAHIWQHLPTFTWSYIPQLAIRSFVEANKLNNELSQNTWKTFFAIQAFGAQTWQKIEEARASLYLAYYNELKMVAETILNT